MDLLFNLSTDLRAAASMRRSLTALSADLDQDLLHDVQLLATELVSNSIVHAHKPDDEIIVHILTYPDTRAAVRLEVTDHGVGFVPRELSPSLHEIHGRGLLMVRTIADRWGVEEDGFMRVWLEIDGANRILVVDDDADNLHMLSLRLNTGGWVVTEALGGEEALDRCHRSRFEVLVLDHMMPIVTGLEVARTLRKEGYARPIFIFSAYLNPDIEFEAHELGVGAIAKPDIARLVDAITLRGSGSPSVLQQ